MTVYALDGWGFVLMPSREEPSPSGVFECVASAAKSLLDRADPDGRPLSHKRIEQLYRSWWRMEYDRWYQNTLAEPPDPDVSLFPPQDWSRFTRESRQRRVPGEVAGRPLADIAAGVLARLTDESFAAEDDDAPLVVFEPELTQGVAARMTKHGLLTRGLRQALQDQFAPRPRGRKKRNRPIK